MTEVEVAERGHFTLKAATTVATEEGTFDAVISTGAVDLEKDIVDPDAMVKALQKWQDVGKLVPLDWNHSEAASDQIGHIDPATAKAVNGEVVASGWIDQSTEAGAQAWRLVKSGTLGFSFFGVVEKSSKRRGGGLHVTALDVVAVTVTTTPMNPGTRVLSWKAIADDLLIEDLPDAVVKACEALNKLSDEAKVDLLRKAQEALGVQYPQQAEVTDKEPQARSVDPLKKQANALLLDLASDGRRQPPTKEPDPVPVPEHLVQKREARRLMLELLS